MAYLELMRPKPAKPAEPRSWAIAIADKVPSALLPAWISEAVMARQYATDAIFLVGSYLRLRETAKHSGKLTSQQRDVMEKLAGVVLGLAKVACREKLLLNPTGRDSKFYKAVLEDKLDDREISGKDFCER